MAGKQLALREDAEKMVELYWLDNEPTLVVSLLEYGAFEIKQMRTKSGKEALDMYYHPYAYAA